MNPETLPGRCGRRAGTPLRVLRFWGSQYGSVLEVFHIRTSVLQATVRCQGNFTDFTDLATGFLTDMNTNSTESTKVQAYHLTKCSLGPSLFFGRCLLHDLIAVVAHPSTVQCDANYAVSLTLIELFSRNRSRVIFEAVPRLIERPQQLVTLDRQRRQQLQHQ